MLIMGAPGANKSTQSTALAEAYSVPRGLFDDTWLVICYRHECRIDYHASLHP